MRVGKGPASRRRKNRLLKRAKGYARSRGSRIRLANATVMRAHQFAKRDRKAKKRAFRSLWITRLGAACRLLGTSYNSFISGLQSQGIMLDRKILANLAVTDAETFSSLVNISKAKREERSLRAA